MTPQPTTAPDPVRRLRPGVPPTWPPEHDTTDAERSPDDQEVPDYGWPPDDGATITIDSDVSEPQPDDPAPLIPIDAVMPTFEAFYSATRTPVGRAVALALGEVDLAVEATDEAYTRACARWSSIRRGNPEGWVYRVAVNWGRSALRQRRRSPHRLYEPSDDTPGVADPAIAAALGALDTKHRAVVVCRHLLGWSVADTAAALRIREGTVKSRLSRASKTLASQLSHLRPDQEQP